MMTFFRAASFMHLGIMADFAEGKCLSISPVPDIPLRMFLL